MKKKQNFSIIPFLIMGVFLVVASSCVKEEDNNTSGNSPAHSATTAVFNPNVSYGTMTDQDGNVYKTVTIGTQTWMAENLRTTKYNDGTAIPLVTDRTAWANLSTGAFCNYNNTVNTDTIDTFGRLYNWYAVQTRKLAPSGWHVPTDAEWTQLTDYLGGESVAGGKLKETGTTHWISPNIGAFNETGFTALPGGIRSTNGYFNHIGNEGYWWTASSKVSNWKYAWLRKMEYEFSDVSRAVIYKEWGFSVRCVKD